MNQALFANPFFTVTLPLMVTFMVGVWATISNNNQQGKRIDDLNGSINTRLDAIDRRLDAIERRLEKIEARLVDHESPVTVLEERTSPLRGIRP
jgi:hypothetical protein